jgi:peptidoglycan/xylan/chitin deacetylase (PgdA/CDA1 family)/glycosyltransferase involved in cell wall biosynthesis
MMKPIFRLLAKGKLTVLLFHKVPVHSHALAEGETTLAEFERVLELATRIFHILPLADALTALQANRLPERAACITFDDGYAEWLRGPVPLLEKHNVHATFFVTTGQFRGVPMWNERILHAVAHAPNDAKPLVLSETGPHELPLGTQAEKRNAVQHLDKVLKYQKPEVKERLLQQLEQHVGMSSNHAPVMSIDDLRAIHAKGFGIGGHAVTHPILSLCTASQAFEEISGAKEELEALLRAPVDAFAYPNGIPGTDFQAEHVDMVKRAGYRFALTTHRGVATAETSLFQVPRFTPWGPGAGRMSMQLLRNMREKPHVLQEHATSSKKALMIAFHFPPQAGSSGILRTLNFVKYLPRNGWQPLVLSAHPRAYVECRDDLLKSIPAHTKVVRAPALDAAKHLSIRGKYPGWFALPDRWASWWPGGIWAGMKLIKQQKPDVIWSTYPIATAHLIGASLAKRSGLPWIADFRDPMITASYPADRMQRRMWQWLEGRILEGATKCVFTSDRAAQMYRVRYPSMASKCVVIENGFDEEAFIGNVAIRTGVNADQLLMLHSGIIYPKDRNPSAFFQAISVLLAQGVLSRESLRIRFRAPHHGDEVQACAERFGVADVVEIAAPIPYREAIAEMMGADLLLVFQGENFNSQIPAKIYEYLRCEKPLLGLVDKSGDTAAQLGEFMSVRLASINDRTDIVLALKKWLKLRQEVSFQEALRKDAIEVHRYSRIHQAGRLSLLMSKAL